MDRREFFVLVGGVGMAVLGRYAYNSVDTHHVRIDLERKTSDGRNEIFVGTATQKNGYWEIRRNSRQLSLSDHELQQEKERGDIESLSLLRLRMGRPLEALKWQADNLEEFYKYTKDSSRPEIVPSNHFLLPEGVQKRVQKMQNDFGRENYEINRRLQWGQVQGEEIQKETVRAEKLAIGANRAEALLSKCSEEALEHYEKNGLQRDRSVINFIDENIIKKPSPPQGRSHELA